jgi:hypothetical protein
MFDADVIHITGQATAEEVAALLAALRTLAAAAPPPAAPVAGRATWTRGEHYRPPGSWVPSSALLRPAESRRS